MKYITVTTRHHDGFSMFDSKISDYNIVKKTPYKKDAIKMLAEACQKEGIKLFLYYSHLDWWHPDYFPRGENSLTWGGNDWTQRPKTGNWDNYRKYMNNQLTELLTNYGEIGGIWFDGWWDQKEKVDWKLKEQYELIHRLQPTCLIGNNHHLAPKDGEDFQMFEKDLPGHNTTGFSGDSKIGELPLEMCETMNGAWGYNLKDKKFKSSKELIQLLVKAAGYNSNFLLNVVPMPDGKIQQQFVDTLAVIGKWVGKYGESIYGTRGGPLTPRSWGITTQKENKAYIHVLDYIDKTLALPVFGKKIKTAKCLNNNTIVSCKQDTKNLLIDIPSLKNEPDIIIELSW